MTEYSVPVEGSVMAEAKDKEQAQKKALNGEYRDPQLVTAFEPVRSKAEILGEEREE